jgi:hypothetical protein
MDKLRLANRFHLRGAVLAIHGPALHKDGRDDVVPAANVLKEFVKEIAVVRAVPQMVMRIANGEIRIEGRFGRQLQPCITRRCHNASSVL